MNRHRLKESLQLAFIQPAWLSETISFRLKAIVVVYILFREMAGSTSLQAFGLLLCGVQRTVVENLLVLTLHCPYPHLEGYLELSVS